MQACFDTARVTVPKTQSVGTLQARSMRRNHINGTVAAGYCYVEGTTIRRSGEGLMSLSISLDFLTIESDHQCNATAD
jgi:hypothetical protein